MGWLLCRPTVLQLLSLWWAAQLDPSWLDEWNTSICWPVRVIVSPLPLCLLPRGPSKIFPIHCPPFVLFLNISGYIIFRVYIMTYCRSQNMSVARDPTSKSAHILFDASFCYVAGRFTFLTILCLKMVLSPFFLTFCFNFNGALRDAWVVAKKMDSWYSMMCGHFLRKSKSHNWLFILYVRIRSLHDENDCMFLHNRRTGESSLLLCSHTKTNKNSFMGPL